MRWRSECCCSHDKNSTLSIQACLNTETLFDRVAATKGMQYSWVLVSRRADKPLLYLEAQHAIWNMWFLTNISLHSPLPLSPWRELQLLLWKGKKTPLFSVMCSSLLCSHYSTITVDLENSPLCNKVFHVHNFFLSPCLPLPTIQAKIDTKTLKTKTFFSKFLCLIWLTPPCMRSDHRSSGHVSQLHLSIDPHSWLEKRENHLWSSSAVKHFQYWPYFFSFLTGGFVMTHGSPSSKRATMKNFEGWQLPLDKTEEKKKLEQVSFELGVYACTEEEFYAALSQSKMQWKECSGWLCGAPRRKGHPA